MKKKLPKGIINRILDKMMRAEKQESKHQVKELKDYKELQRNLKRVWKNK